MKRSLKDATHCLHHAAEHHPIGAAMADGTIPEEWWADWLLALFTVHSVLDPYLPESLRRTNELLEDLKQVNRSAIMTKAAVEYSQTLTDELSRVGATYVFTGAHLMGGAITSKQVRGRLPVNHLEWEDRSKAVKEWSPLRDHLQIKEQAMVGFKYVLEILEEIYANRVGT